MFPGIFHVKENVNRSDVILQKISYHLENIYNVTKKQRFTVLDQKGRNSLSKDVLKEVVDFTSSQCLNLVYKPVLVRGYNRSMGEYPIDTIITDDDLVLGYDQIPIDEVVNVEFGYYNDKHKDRIEKIVVDSIQEVKEIHKKLSSLLGNGGAYYDDLVFCPHHPDKGYKDENPLYKIKCRCRKPEIGMIVQLAEKYNVNLSQSWMVGDSTVDIKTAEKER